MKKIEFLKKYNISEKQFVGEEKIGGDLYLGSLTSLPEGFNPTVGGSLYLRSLTSIPEGFNPTVGGDLDLGSLTSLPEGFNPTVGASLYLRSLTSLPKGFNPTVGGYLDLRSLTSLPEGFNPTVGGYLDLGDSTKYIGAQVPELKINKNFFWDVQEKKYAIIDGIFCEIKSEHVNRSAAGDYTVYSGKSVNKDEHFYIVRQGEWYAHGTDLFKAYDDLQFKKVADKLKSEPINKDTIISIRHYRMLTGACELGCNKWLSKNNLTGVGEMRADKLLPLLEKTNAYGIERFKKLVTFS